MNVNGIPWIVPECSLIAFRGFARDGSRRMKALPGDSEFGLWGSRDSRIGPWDVPRKSTGFAVWVPVNLRNAAFQVNDTAFGQLRIIILLEKRPGDPGQRKEHRECRNC